MSSKLHHWGHANEGPGFEKIQVCKMPYESAKIISDWEGITDNLRQSVILQYSDIGKYLLPVEQWNWILHTYYENEDLKFINKKVNSLTLNNHTEVLIWI